MEKRNRRINLIILVLSFIVLIMGASFAYYALRIRNNTLNKSLSIKTDKLELRFVNTSNTLEPEGRIYPGTTVASKTFDVVNEGEEAEYIVDLENIDIHYTKTGAFETAGTSTTLSSDFVYTLTCTSTSGTCNGVTEAVFPNTDTIVVTNKIAKNVTHSYTLSVIFKETNVDQNSEMNKTFSAKVNIKDIRGFNPFSSNQNSLAYKIVDNASKNEDGTRLVLSTDTNVGADFTKVIYDSVGVAGSTSQVIVYSNQKDYYFTYADDYLINEETGKFDLINPKTCKYSDSGCIKDMVNSNQVVYILSKSVTGATTVNGGLKNATDLDSIFKVKSVTPSSSNDSITVDEIKAVPISDENILALAEDDYGYSFFYRGDVINNYVTFNNMCWRIIRIKGNGDIKLILEDKDEACSSNMNGDWKIGNYNFGYEKIDTSNYKNIKYLDPTEEAENSISNRLKVYQTNFSNNYDKMATADFCLDDLAYNSSGTSILSEATKQNYLTSKKAFYYDSYVRLRLNKDKMATLKCNGKVYNKYTDDTPMYISLITIDEAAFAGIKVGLVVFESTLGNYLINDYFKTERLNIWTSSPFDHAKSSGDSIFGLSYTGTSSSFGISLSSTYGVRPVITLSKNVTATGNGTISNPYIVL